MLLGSWGLKPGGEKYLSTHFASFPTLKTQKRAKKEMFKEIRIDFLNILEILRGKSTNKYVVRCS